MSRAYEEELKQAHALLTAALAYYEGVFVILADGTIASLDGNEIAALVTIEGVPVSHMERFSNLEDGAVIFAGWDSKDERNDLASDVYGGEISGEALVMSGKFFSYFMNERKKKGIK